MQKARLNMFPSIQNKVSARVLESCSDSGELDPRLMYITLATQSKGGARSKAPGHNRRTDPSAPGSHQGMEWYGGTGPSSASLHEEILDIHMGLQGTENGQLLHLSEQPPLRKV
jgi:hypothetical protein